jgi:hypothetical protein
VSYRGVRERAGKAPRVRPEVSQRRVLAALEQLGVATAEQVADAAGTPPEPTRRALLALTRSGAAERALDASGALYAPTTTNDAATPRTAPARLPRERADR